MHRIVSSLLAVMGFAMVAAAPGPSRASNLTTLVTFCSLPNCADGATPLGDLIADADGNLFGTTSNLGANGKGGTVFEIAKTYHGYANTLTVLYSFCALANCTDGERPTAPPIIDANGNLFGTTANGGANLALGANDVGTVFEIVKTASGYANTATTLVSFCALANCADGANPMGGLFADPRGNLFGTAATGGSNGAPLEFGGTVFEIVKTPQGQDHDVDRRNHDLPGLPDYASTPAPVASFCSLPSCTDGNSPRGGVIADANGNFFGTTLVGGANGQGTVFEIVKTAGGYASTPTPLASFCALANCADGANPEAGLVADAKGNLFGTTRVGGANGQGTVFEIVTTAAGYANTLTVLYSFCALANCADGANPEAGLIADAKGNLFGTTFGGGANGQGTVFEIAKTRHGYADTLTVLYSFCALANCADGANPMGGLMADAKGNLFGTAGGHMNFSGATAYEITDSGFVVSHKFDGTPRSPSCFGQSASALIQKYGGLYGAAEALGHSSVPALQDAIMEFCED